MTPLRLTTRLTLALIALGLVALAVSIGGTAWAIARGARAQAIALASFEADEIDRKAAGDPVVAAAAVRIRTLASATNRGRDCRAAARDARIFLLEEAGARDGTPGVRWPGPPSETGVVRLHVPRGAACLARDGTAYGVARNFHGGRYLVAWLVPADPLFWWRAGLIGSVAFAVFASLGGGVALLFGAAQMQRIRALNAVLDRVEDSGFTVRAPREGLGPELAELAEHVDAMIRRMGELTSNLSRLAVHIAHDLRSPLDALHRKLGRLGAQLGDPGGFATLEEAQAQVDTIVRRCVQLLEIVRIEAATRDSYTTIDLADQIALVVDEVFADAAAERGVAIGVDAAPIPLRAMTEMIQRLLTNLLQNAVAFAAPGSVIRIGATIEPGFARLAIENDGPQVPPDRLQAIFEPHVSTPAAGGRGYGLGCPSSRRSRAATAARPGPSRSQAECGSWCACAAEGLSVTQSDTNLKCIDSCGARHERGDKRKNLRASARTNYFLTRRRREDCGWSSKHRLSPGAKKTVLR